MSNLENRVEMTSKTTPPKLSLFFNRSMSMYPTPEPKKGAHHSNVALDHAGSFNKIFNSMETMRSATTSLKGKVKKLCSFFETERPQIDEPQGNNNKQLRVSKTMAHHSSSKSMVPDFRVLSIRLPRTDDRIVMYLTSLRGVRRTYEDCYAVRNIFRGFGVWVDERDISMDSEYRKELQGVLGAKSVSLPQVFIKGKYVGGAEVIKQLFETGELAKILQGVPVRKPGAVCGGCGDARFVPCVNCSGSRKVYDEEDDTPRRCGECNENGLIRCPNCCC